MEATGRHVHTVISLNKKYDLGIGIDMNLLSTINKILIDDLSTSVLVMFLAIDQLLIRPASCRLY